MDCRRQQRNRPVSLSDDLAKTLIMRMAWAQSKSYGPIVDRRCPECGWLRSEMMLDIYGVKAKSQPHHVGQRSSRTSSSLKRHGT